MKVVTENNKRIFKNTIFLYFRQILIMTVSLYTVRVVLTALGEEDYGIFNVVGGFVSMFNILSGALSVAISRFITYEMGQPDVTSLRLQRIFSSSLIIQVVMGLIICLLIATFGVWFVENKMVIPSERLDVTLYVLLFSTLSFFINLLSVPYNALIIAHEQMKAFAYISIVEAILKLLIAYLLLVTSIDKLLLYALCMVLVSLIIRTIYIIYCKRHFNECCFTWGFDKQLLSKMFVFSGWAFLGNGVVVLKDQGSNILLNLFGGPIVNAAQGIAMQINNAVYSFVSNFMIASNPQITKNYALGDMKAMHTLIIRSGKFGFFILLIILLPLCAGIDYVLALWLVDVPSHTSNFVILVLLYSLVECFVSPLTTGMLAQGSIRNFEIALTFIYLINFFVSYICLKGGMVVETIFVLNIVFKVIVLLALLLHGRLKYAFPISRFIRECFLPSIIVLCISSLLVNLIFGKGETISSLWLFTLRTLVIVIFTGIVIFTIGMTKGEKVYMQNLIKGKIVNKFNSYRKTRNK